MHPHVLPWAHLFSKRIQCMPSGGCPLNALQPSKPTRVFPGILCNATEKAGGPKRPSISEHLCTLAPLLSWLSSGVLVGHRCTPLGSRDKASGPRSAPCQPSHLEPAGQFSHLSLGMTSHPAHFPGHQQSSCMRVCTCGC